MRRDWILDVLADLKAFARASDMPMLAEQLDDSALVALAEIALLEEKGQRAVQGRDQAGGAYSGSVGRC